MGILKRSQRLYKRVEIRAFGSFSQAQSSMGVTTDALMQNITACGLLAVRYAESVHELRSYIKELSEREAYLNYVLVRQDRSDEFTNTWKAAVHHLETGTNK